MKPARWSADLSLAAVALIWGSTFVLVKNALDDVSTILFLALRFSVATAILAAVYTLRGRSWQFGGWRAGLTVGTFLYVGYVLQTIGLRYTTPAKSGFITGLYIVIVPLLSAVVYKRMPGPFEWIGVMIASVGLGLLTLDFATFRVNFGDILTVGCAVAFAIHILLLDRNSKKMESDWLALLQVGACAAYGLSTFWWVESVYIRWDSTLLLALAVTSVLATALAFWIQTWAQKHTTATRAALVFSLEPVFAWLTSFVVADERLTTTAVSGAICILSGIVLVELKPMPSRFHQVP